MGLAEAENCCTFAAQNQHKSIYFIMKTRKERRRWSRRMACLLGVMCSVALSAQVRVSGTVTDAQKEPVIGASVLERGTGTGTVTDMDGQFTLEVASEKSVLEISYVGMKTQTVSVAGKPSIQVVLQEDQEVLDEVVVIGYGTQKRKDVTTAISSVSTEDIENFPSPPLHRLCRARRRVLPW